MTKTTTEGVAAALFIYDAPNMTKRGRREIAKWIREQARHFEHHHADLAKTFRARYMYPKKATR